MLTGTRTVTHTHTQVYPFNFMPLVEGTQAHQLKHDSSVHQHKSSDNVADYDVMASLWAPSPAWAAAGAIISPLSGGGAHTRV